MTVFIETPRLIIRELQLEDCKGMFEMDSDPKVHEFVGRQPVQTPEQSLEIIHFVRQQYQDHGIGRWAIVEKTSGEFVGWTGFKFMTERINGFENFIDFGYRLKQKNWGLGYASESGRAVLDYGIKNLGYASIYAMTDLNNQASRNVLRKLDFTLISIFEYDGSPTWRNIKEKTTWYERKPANTIPKAALY